MGKPSPDWGAKQDRLLRDAARVIATMGFEHLTSQRLHREFDQPCDGLRYYFGNRDEMLWVLVSRRIDAVLECADVPESLPPVERLRLMAGRYANATGSDRSMHVAALMVLQRLSQERRADARIKQRWVLETFADAMLAAAPGQTRGQARVLALSLLALLNSQAQWLRDGGPLRRADYAGMAVRMVLSEAGVSIS